MKKSLIAVMCCAAVSSLVAMKTEMSEPTRLTDRSEEALVVYRKAQDQKSELRNAIVFHLNKIKGQVYSRNGGVANANIQELYQIAQQVKLLSIYAPEVDKVEEEFLALINKFKHDFGDFRTTYQELEENDKKEKAIEILQTINGSLYVLSNDPQMKRPYEGYKQIN